ncbi:MFS transporter [Nocardia inohanensis]|uniref:MFS transporter n=1 Tax=Nocardia inohanensis TaxID=209246 RepID=UPI00082EEDAA|nr:MFS transporter [Nocardia inohanensis]
MTAPHTDIHSAPPSARALRWTLTVSCAAVALVIASMAALYTALPQIAVSTGATQAQLTWVVDGYTLALACLVLPGGALGDRYGRRGVLIAGLVVFCLGAALPLLLRDPLWLIAARAVSGAGAALVMPSTLSMLTAGFPEHLRSRAIGLWAGVAGAGGGAGLLGSGLIMQRWDWPAIFIGLAAGAAVLAVAAVRIPESRDYTRPRIDFAGAATSAAAVGLFVAAITEAPHRSWLDPLTLGLCGGASVALGLFVLAELRVSHPLLPIRLFARRGFSSGIVSLTLQFLVTFGVFLLLVQHLQLILGYSPLKSAAALIPMMLPVVTLAIVAPWLTDRLGLRLMTCTGMSILAAGLALMTRITVHTGYLGVLWPMLISGIGLGLCATPATAAIVADTPVEKHGVAAAVNDATREIGAAIGIALAGSLLAAGYRDRIRPALPRLPEAVREPVADSLAAALAVADHAGPAARPLADFAKESFVHGNTRATLVLAVIAAAGAVLALAAPGRPRRDLDHPFDLRSHKSARLGDDQDI